MSIWVIRLTWNDRPPESVGYERARDAESAVRQAFTRGIGEGAGRSPHFLGMVAEPPVYYLADPEIDNIVSQAQDFGAIVGRGIDIFREYDARHVREHDYLDILVGDSDGPDDQAARLTSNGYGGWGLHVDKSDVVPAEWLRVSDHIHRVVAPDSGEHQVRVDGVPIWAVPKPSGVFIPPSPSMDQDIVERFQKLEFDEGPRREYRRSEEEPDDSRKRFSLLELNPAFARRTRHNPAHADADAAVAKYQEFHRFAPKKLGEFSSGFAIPARVRLCGKGKWVTYRSDKIDPATLKKPRNPVDYIHDFDAAVLVHMTKGKGDLVDVPEEFRHVDALVLLGQNLGFCFETDDAEIEAVSTPPLPELYATPDGHCLLVVQSKRDVKAMIWGGALGVFARGIDG